MPKNQVLWLIALLLIALGGGLAWYKHVVLGFSLVPATRDEVWTIEAQIQFTGTGAPITASFAVPNGGNGFDILMERYASLGYGVSKLDGESNNRVEWTKREVLDTQQLYYQILVRRSNQSEEISTVPPETPQSAYFDESALMAAQSLLAEARAKSSDVLSLARILHQTLISTATGQNTAYLLPEGIANEEGLALLLEKLLVLDGVSTRTVQGLYLDDRKRFQPIQQALEIWDGTQWVFFDPRSGTVGNIPNFFVWRRGGASLLDLVGGTGSQVRFSILRELRPTTELASDTMAAKAPWLTDFSLYVLPVEEQNAFRRLLLVPVGALLIVIIRNLVGISTAGTFMPILLALSFEETRLLPGLILFIVIVGTGLTIRALLSDLNLLAVPRITAVVIVVIFLMALFSIVNHKFSFAEGLKVTFFPMIIIAWTIERLSIVWEEEGSRACLLRATSTVIVASLAYGLINLDIVRHLIFTFPELILVILAIVLILGQYTGYRLTELLRFSYFKHFK